MHSESSTLSSISPHRQTKLNDILLLLVLLLLVSPAFTQTTPANAIKFNPLSLIFRGASLAYERSVNASQSFQLGVMYSGLRLRKHQYEGLRITPAYRFYLGASSNSLNGVYAGPFAQFQRYTVQRRSSHTKARFSSYGAGFLFGWEKTSKSGLLLDIFAGPSFGRSNLSNNEDDFDLNSQFHGFGLKTGIAVGFAF